MRHPPNIRQTVFERFESRANGSGHRGAGSASPSSRAWSSSMAATSCCPPHPDAARRSARACRSSMTLRPSRCRAATDQAAPDERKLEPRSADLDRARSSRRAARPCAEAGGPDRALRPARRRQDQLRSGSVGRLGGEGEVPSPTFSLVQAYARPRFTVHIATSIGWRRASSASSASTMRLQSSWSLSNGPSGPAAGCLMTASTSPSTRRRRQIVRRVMHDGPRQLVGRG